MLTYPPGLALQYDYKLDVVSAQNKKAYFDPRIFHGQ